MQMINYILSQHSVSSKNHDKDILYSVLPRNFIGREHVPHPPNIAGHCNKNQGGNDKH